MPAMPVWLLKILPYLGAVLLVGAAIWYIDHKGYQRAEKENELENTRADNLRKDMKIYIDGQTKEVERGMQDFATKTDENFGRRLGQLDIQERTIVQPTITREIRSEARFSDPSVGITDGMLNALNQARSASGGSCSSAPDGSVTCDLPAAEPTQ